MLLVTILAAGKVGKIWRRGAQGETRGGAPTWIVGLEGTLRGLGRWPLSWVLTDE